MKLLKSKNFIVLVLLIIVSPVSLFAQGLEFGVLLGASNYYGDLNGQDMLPSETHPAIGLVGRYDLKERWTVKGYLGYGHISGSDALSKSAGDKQRNLSFYTDIYEASIQMELNLVRNAVGYNGNNKLIPYLYVGLGLFNFNPKADYLGESYELQPLGTEGQNTTEYNQKEKYSLTEFCIPMGFGFKKRVGRHFSLGLDIGMRYTFTNYLDDIGGVYADNRVIERGNGRIAAALADRSTERDGAPLFKEGDPRSRKWLDINDIYVIGGISIAYRFTPNTVRCPKF